MHPEIKKFQSGKWFLTGVSCLGLMMRLGAEAPVPEGLQLVSFQGQEFLVRIVDLQHEDLELFWKDASGELISDFPRLEQEVQTHIPNKTPVFSANAGMFEPDFTPVGLLVQNGREQVPLNLKTGQGNFYLKPNGIFLLNQKREAHILEASEYPHLPWPAVWATQSGPLLVRNGGIHPAFIQGSVNRKLRSGVGVRKDGKVVFVISQGGVNFYDFAAFFLQSQNCPNALFLDGEISAFFVPGMKRMAPHQFGPIIGVVK